MLPSQLILKFKKSTKVNKETVMYHGAMKPKKKKKAAKKKKKAKK